MRIVALIPVLLLAACSRAPAPAKLDPGTARCARCSHPVSDVHFAAQLVAPGEEPRFFDDIGCLRDWLRSAPHLPRGAVAYVADHRTGEWVRADRAAYAVAAVSTPSGSHLVANADAGSRKEDDAARNGRFMTPSETFGPGLPPAGAQ